MMSKIRTVIVHFLLIQCVCACYQQKKQPNILVILVDDVGWNDAGFHGSNQIPTPNIDALAYNGIMFSRYYTQQTCTPSRAAFLTGNYPIKSAFQGIPIRPGEDRHLPLNMPTLPERLKELGYRTHLVGKWHLGSSRKIHTPTFKGYDSHFGYWNGFVGYFDHSIAEGDMTGLDFRENFEPLWSVQGKYATDLFTEQAIKTIKNREKSKPFFLVLSHLAGHTGLNGTELGVPNVTKTNEEFSYINDENRRLYAGVINSMDKSVGDLVKTLSTEKVLDNTVILFSSDNGAQTVGLYQNSGSNWPLRGLKFTLLEGGVRNLGFVYSAKFQRKGIISEELIHITDWLPTFYAAGGGNIENLGTIDGINQWPVLTRSKKGMRTEILLNIDERNNVSAIIGENGRYKLVNGSFSKGIYDSYYGENGRGSGNPPYNIKQVLESDTNTAIHKLNVGGRLTPSRITYLRSKSDLSNCREQNNTAYNFLCTSMCLFDLHKDPCETLNVAAEYPEVVEKLSAQIEEYWAELVPQPVVGIDPTSNPIYFNNTWYTWLDVVTR